MALVGSACSPPGGAVSSSAGDEAVSAAEELGIDLDECGTDPTVEFGKTVKVGETVALTGGPAAFFAPVAGGLAAMFGAKNEEGRLDTTFEVITKDDQFTPNRALTATQGLLDQDGVELMTSTVGTAQVLAVRDLLNSECVPLVPATSGGSETLNAESHPWVVNVSPPFTLDARIWVEDVTNNYPEGAKIALYTGNTESGKDYNREVKRWLKGTNHELVSEQTIEATDAAAPSSQVTTMRSSGADVLFAAPTGAQCSALLTEVANQGWEPDRYVTATCASGALFTSAGDAADGAMAAQYVKDPSLPRWSGDPDVKAFDAALRNYSPNTQPSFISAVGYFYGEQFWEAAERASKSDLGLSRLGILQAATTLDFEPSMAIPGVRVKLDGLKDSVAIESSELGRWDASTGDFTPIKLYDFEGQFTP